MKENDKGRLFIENNTEFLVYQALRRRGLAYEFADLITYTVHQRWVDWLFAELSKEQPARFQKVQMFQILRADKAAWLHMADVVKDIRPSDGSRPLEADMPCSRQARKDSIQKVTKWKGNREKAGRANAPPLLHARKRDVVRVPW